MTVCGPLSVDGERALRWLLPHEHILHSIGASTNIIARDQIHSSTIVDNDISMEKLHTLRTAPWRYGNLLMEKGDEVFRELELVSAANGAGLIVDVTTAREGRVPNKLYELAQRCDGQLLHLVMSTSCDLESAQGVNTGRLNEDEMCEQIAKAMETELVYGIAPNSSNSLPQFVAQCPFRAGIIYQQIHCSNASAKQDDLIMARSLGMV